MVCHHTLSKMVWFHTIKLAFHTKKFTFHTPQYVIIPTIVISYHSGINSYPHMTFHTVKVLIHTFTCHCILVLFHTKTCHFILATTCFIRIRNVSYVQILFHTFENLFHTYMYCFIRAHVISSYHTYIYCFIPTHVISYLRQPFSYVNVLFHTYTRDFRWNVCDQSHCTCVY